jgi:hypothetical protein
MKIIIPNGCSLNLLTEQWVIFGAQGWTIEGAGILGLTPVIQYCGPTGRDSTVKIDRSGGWTVKGVTITSKGIK